MARGMKLHHGVDVVQHPGTEYERTVKGPACGANTWNAHITDDGSDLEHVDCRICRKKLGLELPPSKSKRGPIVHLADGKGVGCRYSYGDVKLKPGTKRTANLNKVTCKACLKSNHFKNVASRYDLDDDNYLTEGMLKKVKEKKATVHYGEKIRLGWRNLIPNVPEVLCSADMPWGTFLTRERSIINCPDCLEALKTREKKEREYKRTAAQERKQLREEMELKLANPEGREYWVKQYVKKLANYQVTDMLGDVHKRPL